MTVQSCARCILDTQDDPNIIFDDNGVCNYCHEYDTIISHQPKSEEERKKALDKLVEKIKSEGRNKKYDCIIGVSGGVDSTYLAYMVKELGLRPLVVHFDNGWNSELAVKNIENLLNTLGLDLVTYVNDWLEFKDIQLSFIKASVIDIELVSDQGIFSLLYQYAQKHKIKYILTGHNNATEAILPPHWYHWKSDVLNIKAIHKQFGRVKMKTYPRLGYFQKLYATRILGIKTLSLLDLLPYNKDEAKSLMINKLGWKDYGGKHFESIFTRFYQSYILPEKFKVDKRKAHLSTLVISGQMTRQEALEEIKTPPYDPKMLEEDKEYVIKKLGLTEKEFEGIMKAPIKKHTDYPSYLTKHYKIEAMISKKLKFITRPLKRFLFN